MSGPADSANAVFRAFNSVALGVFNRTRVWTSPARIVRYAAEIKGRAPAALHGALDDLFFGPVRKGAVAPTRGAGGSATVKVPTYLVNAVQDHLSEFSRLYAISRSESNLYGYAMLRNLEPQWQVLKQQLERINFPDEAIVHIERHMLERMNHLIGREDLPVGRLMLGPAKAIPAGRTAARALWENAERWARASLSERGLPMRALEDGPFTDLDPFGKLMRIFPEGDPAWRELGDFVATNPGQGSGPGLQGLIGELVALRTPGVLAFMEQETKRILRENADLLAQGWRVVFQPQSAFMAKSAKAMPARGGVPAEGLPGIGLSFDFSVWVVKDDIAMPLIRGQVKSGQVDNATSGVTQSLTKDEWRGFSDFVQLTIDGKAQRFSLRPPDSYHVVRILVVAKDSPRQALEQALPVGGALEVFELPLTGKEMGMIGNALHRSGAGKK